jgi:hypothetical protein
MSTYTPISTQTLASAANSITFTGIPQTYTDLRIVIANAKATNTARNVFIRVGNGTLDTGSNYSHTNLGARSLSTTPFSARESNQSQGKISWYTAMTTAQAQMSIVDIMNYSNTTTNKTMLSSTRVQEGDGTYSGVEDLVILWRSTLAINTISILTDVADTFQSGATFTLYGIGSGSPKAFGGDIVTTDGTYWYHTFNTSGVFSPVTNLSCDYLVVAGGGGGGSTQNNSLRGAGGGGAGGFLTATGFSVTLGSNLTVTVGAGGVGGASNTYANGTSGSDSVFSTITSSGGGFGAQGRSDANRPGGSGGSGGGGGNTSDGFTAIGGTGTSGQGNNGGNGGVSASGGAGGSGGGAGGAGGNGGTGSGAGNITGGAGSASSITGSSITYAIGGRGGGYNATPVAGPNGTANLGEGGGGRSGGSATAAGGNGGSGIVIVRYLV